MAHRKGWTVTDITQVTRPERHPSEDMPTALPILTTQRPHAGRIVVAGELIVFHPPEE